MPHNQDSNHQFKLKSQFSSLIHSQRTTIDFTNYKLVIIAWTIMLSLSALAWCFNIEFLQLTEPNGWLNQASNRLNSGRFFSLFLITESVSFPYGAVTALLLTLCFSKLLRLSIKQTYVLLLILGITVLIGLEIKSLIKQVTSEPRPYMLWLANLAEPIKLDLDKYYALTDKSTKRAALTEIIQQPIIENWHLPNWLQSHWIKDSEYSFPSGHTFFAALFALLSVGLFSKGSLGHKFFVFCLFGWALFVMLSRLMLGMHSPIDLIGGSTIALFCSLIGIYLINRFVFISVRRDTTT